MGKIILALTAGLAVGAFGKFNAAAISLNSRLQYLGVVALLLFMGISLGMRQDILSNIQLIGWKALVFALMTTVFSVIIVYCMSIFLNNESKRGQRNG